MPSSNYITAACTITRNRVTKNGEVIFYSAEDVAGFLLSLYQHTGVNYPKFYKMDNLSKLGFLTAEILLKENFNKESYQPEQIGIVFSNANSSLDNDLKYFDSVSEVASPALFVYTLPNIVIGEICIRNNFKGEHALYVQENFDADFIAHQVDYLLGNYLLQTCICGWVDLLGQGYNATLFLVEKEAKGLSLLFNSANMDNIFKEGSA